MTLIARIIGWIAAHAPTFVPAVAASLLARISLRLSPTRRRMILSNLDHAFPDMPLEWRMRTALNSRRQRIENRLLALALPFFTVRRLRSMLHLTPAAREALLDLLNAREPTVLAIPQVGAWELVNVLPLLCPGHRVNMGIPYPSIADRKLDRWLRRGRSRFGVRITDSENGFLEGLTTLRENGIYGVLFDQWHPRRGLQTLLFNRLTTVSELPGILVERYQTRLVGLYTERISFWHYAMRFQPIEAPKRAGPVAADLNGWLEQLLRKSDSACGSWPWGQERWRLHPSPRQALRLDQRRPMALSSTELPRCWRLWIRLPDNLGRTLKFMPLVRALRASRPDAAITFLGRQPILDLLRPAGLSESDIVLPSRPLNLRQFVRLQMCHPDITLILEDDARQDAAAWFTGCPVRLGLERPGDPRPLLTSAWKVPEILDERRVHETRLLEYFLRHFGLNAPRDNSPLALTPGRRPQPGPKGTAFTVGLICSARSQPAREWPIENWRSLAGHLLRAHPWMHLKLFGPPEDRGVFGYLTEQLQPDRFTPVAERADLSTFALGLEQCDLVIAHDCSGLHLANALGVPVIGLYGPGNPVRTGPIYEAPCRILLPPGCPPTGGASLASLTVTSVQVAVERSLRRAFSAAAAA